MRLHTKAAGPIHPAWKILFACCLVQFGGLGVLSNSIGVFFPAVCASLHCTTAQISLHVTIRGFAMMAALPLASRLISRYPSRLVLTPAAVVLVCSVGSMAFFSKLWQWYVASVFYGFAGGFLFLNMSPILLTNWFFKRRGFAVGMAMAFAGLGGIVMNPLGNALIESLGWRAAYLIFAGIGAACILPFTLFVLKRRPEDAGVRPYGAEQSGSAFTTQAEGRACTRKRPAGTLAKDGVLWVFLGVVTIAVFETVFIYHFPGFALSVGLTTAVGSMMSSASMAGNLASKFFLGWLNDRAGSKRAFLLGAVFTMTGIMLIQVFQRSPELLIAGSFLYGASMSMPSVLVPLLILDLFDRGAYTSVLSLSTMTVAAMGGMGVALVGWIYDVSGGFTAAFWMAQAACAVGVCLLMAAFRMRNRRCRRREIEK
ncbi:MAG TPA: MFS transporter [Eubacteriales bacterium]|nr:MFS transporter [Eubacteriales bacterium]